MEGLINKMKGIHKDPNRALSPKSGNGLPSSLGSHSTGGGGASSLLLNKRLTLPFLAVVAALAVGLLFLLPGGLLQAQETSKKTVEYTENATISVLTLSASDPEGAAPIVWSKLETLPSPAPDVGGTALAVADIADHERFDVSQSGVLTFKMKPSFEDASVSGDDSYKVVVVASDGNMPSYFKVTVNVQDEEEEGSVKLQPTGQTAATLLQPQVGVGITAHSLTDPDGPTSITATGWRWYRSSSKTATGTAISSNTPGSTGTEAAYTPVAADVGKYLRVVATYNDGRGNGKTAAAVSEYQTIARISSNTGPEFSAASTTRVVLEGADAGTTIGSPVTATDGDSGERLTYWLTAGADNDLFNIDAMTGQLKVKTKLNYEGTTTSGGGTDQCTAANACAVTVNAADSSGTATDDIAVTINVIAVDEKPMFSAGPTTIMREEGMIELGAEADVTYTAMDPESASVTLSLSGTDASKFELNDPDPVAAGSKVLAFKDKPDFEMPGDSNRDNVYQVTVVASDGVNSAMRDVIVKVTDMAETGKIEVAPMQPRVGTVLTATLTDSDGVMGPTWKWRKLMVASCPAQDSDDWTPDPDTTLIKDAESATYTPVVDDDGYCLRVEASYLDMNYDSAMLFAKRVAFVLGGKVQGSSTNMAPMFADTRAMRYVPEDAMSATDTMVNVGMPVKAKDTDTLEYTLGGADASLFNIVQMDDDTTGDIDEEGQIQVKVGAMLDHETKPTLTVTVTVKDPRQATDIITVTIKVTDVDEVPTATNFVITAPPYTENATISVLTLSASDPEGAAPIVWSKLETLPSPAPDVGGTALAVADIADHERFDVSQSGVLTFKMKPSFEDASVSGDDSYKVVVVASDGNMPSYFKVIVNVQDEEEEGSVKLQPTGQTAATLLQPQVGVGITAHSLTDPDGPTSITATGWRWYRSSSKTATGTAISSNTPGSTGTEAAYTPVAADVGKYLRVVATYNDGRGNGKTAAAVSEYQTISTVTNNTGPEFSAASTTRVVLEGADAGTTIGSPVTATDGDSGERLTYWLTAGADNDLFNIDAMTGQLKVKTKLNYEGTTTSGGGTDQCTAANACAVTVNAADSSGTATDDIAVTINVIAVDEKPMFSAGPTTIMREEGMIELGAEADVTYTAMDPESASVTLSLSGTDASKFELNDPDPVAAGSKVLAFKDKPDFEMPGDSNRDNVYQVTVVASDGVNSAMRDVIVKVTDMAETGKIEVAPMQPRVGTVLTATLTDSDGVMGPTWKWRKLMVASCPAQDSDDWTPDPDTTLIKDAESATYTPVVDDDGYCLRVEASYLDMNYDSAMLFAKRVAFVLGGKVQGSSTNMAPMFADTRAMRYVPEDAMSATDTMVNVGMPVKAKDTDTLEYTLGGADASLFNIVQMDDDTTGDIDEEGQIQVKVGAMLDHETKPTLTVTVTVKDPRQATDIITVTIKVTDVDEVPMIMVGGLTILGMSMPYYAENGMDAVETYTLAGPMKDMATLTLEGADAGDFMLSSGMLSFRSSPNYEMPTDADMDNTYMVTLKANDGTYMDTHNVMVMVINEDETGRVTFWRDGADVTTAAIAVGDMLTGLAEDPDGNVGDTLPITDMYPNITGATWQWAKTMTPEMMDSWMDITGATDAVYTVMDDDDEYHLRATAMYDDREGMGKMASEETMMVTMNPSPMFPSAADTREVAENTAAGMNIGAPVMATDADSPTLVYTLGGLDAASFDIGPATGQLMTKAALDYEMPRGADMSDTNTNDYMVTVTATDPEGAYDMITVTIMVTDVVNEEMTLLQRYDADGNGEIDKPEVVTAINDYLFGVGDDAITKPEVIEVINLYLFGG